MEPHYFEGGTYCSPRRTDLTNQELMEYFVGYNDCTDRKDWG